MKLYLLSFIILFTISYTRAQSPVLWGLTYAGGTQTGGTIFSFNTGTNQPVTNYSFGTDTDGVRPNGTMLEATDGYFYGTTFQGGSKTEGTIFSYNVTSGDEKVVHSFADGADGGNPGYALIQVNDSVLYGVTQNGGSSAVGTIFSYNILSGQETVDYAFGGDTDAANPIGPLFQLNDSLLYGLCNGGGSHLRGAIYKYNMVTEEESVVHSFGSDTDGRYSSSGLIKASDGLLYGTTYAGGRNNAGTIFNFNPATGVETVLHSFGGALNSVSPYSPLIQVTDSDLYGVSFEGGAHSVGTIFKYNIYSHVTTQLHDFGGTGDGQYPYYGPLFMSNNLLYGMTNMGGANGYGIIYTYDLALDTEIDVYDFATGNFGEEPKGGFVEYNAVTAVKQLSVNSEQLSVYPNPSSDFINIDLTGQQNQPVQLSLYNLLGQIVYSINITSNLTATVPVTGLAEGVYILKVNSGSESQQREIVVAK